MNQDLLAILGCFYAVASFASLVVLAKGLIPERHGDWEASGPQVLGLMLLAALLALTAASLIVESA